MADKSFALVEMLLFAAIALGIGFWQLWSVNRDIKRGRESREKDDPPSD